MSKIDLYIDKETPHLLHIILNIIISLESAWLVYYIINKL